MNPTPGTIPVLLYGPMRKKFGKVRHLAVKTPAEAVRALMATVPGFRAYLQDNIKSNFHVLIGDTDIGEKNLCDPVGRTECIKIIPVVQGAKDPMWQTIGGAILFYAGTVVSAIPGWQAVGSFMMSIGVSMMLGGVAQMLAGTPPGSFTPDSLSDKETFGFSNPTLTTGQGGCVPVGYGRVRVGGHVISAGIDAQTWQTGGFGGRATVEDGTRYGDGDLDAWVWAIAPV